MKRKQAQSMSPEHRRHIGMRIIKTVIAVFLCGVLAFLRNTSALYSMFAALFSVQNSAGKTIGSSIDRALGTLIGGVVGVLTVHAMDSLSILHIDLLRYLVIALLLIPVIEFCVAIKKSGCAGMACMVIMCLAVDPGDKPAIDSIERLFETVVGVALACGIDLLLPYQAPQGTPEGAEAAQPPVEASGTEDGEPSADAPETEDGHPESGGEEKQ